LTNCPGWDNWLGVPMNESFRAQTWGYIPSNTSIGTTYDKALYRGYTGSDFTEQSEQPDWLGFNGPILRGEVGDMIEVSFPLPSIILPDCEVISY
jgi:manganese oxidase